MDLSVKKFLVMKSHRMPGSKISPGRPMAHSHRDFPGSEGLERGLLLQLVMQPLLIHHLSQRHRILKLGD